MDRSPGLPEDSYLGELKRFGPSLHPASVHAGCIMIAEVIKLSAATFAAPFTPGNGAGWPLA